MEMCWNFFWEPHGVFYILFCDSIYFLHSYYCCVIVEFLLPFSCLNEISVPTSLSICVLRAWCPIRMEPIKYYLFFIELWKQGHQMYQFIGEGGVIIMCASICICANVYMVRSLHSLPQYFKIIYWYLITLLFWHVWVYLIWQPPFGLIVVLEMDLYDFARSCVNWVIQWTIAYHIDLWPENMRSLL